jgi:CheY-like chemotaxis protein
VVEPERAPGKSILVIDDEEAVLDVVRRFLEIAGHKVRCVTSGREGIDQFTAHSPIDLVILDLMMPREDATVTYQRIRQVAPEVPVLLCTGLAEAEPAPKLLRQPATGLIRKPFRMNELWYAVKQALGTPD